VYWIWKVVAGRAEMISARKPELLRATRADVPSKRSASSSSRAVVRAAPWDVEAVASELEELLGKGI
jgi:hypothetical protein